MIHKHICKVCEKKYESVRTKGKYCSLSCRNKGYIGRVRPEWEKKKISETMKKHIRTPQHIRNNNLAMLRGEKHPCWKGGKHIEAKGYIMVLRPDHPNSDVKGYIMEHRVVMEKHLGRYLLKNVEVVHHIDGNRQNNLIDNLMLFPNPTSHDNYHRNLRKLNSKG